jgi:hypothetical protein
MRGKAKASPRRHGETLCYFSLRLRGELFLLLFLLAPAAYAQRKNHPGAQIDFMGGGSNQIGGSNYNLAAFQSGMAPFYGVTPTLELKSLGANSELDLSCSFQWQRYNGDSVITTMSHMADMNLTARLSKTVRSRFNGSFYSAPDYTSFNVLRGIAFTPEGFRYVFEPALARRSSYTGNTLGSLDVDVGPKSYLTLGGSASYRHYDKIASRPVGLSDQLRVEGNVAFNRKLSSRHTWHVKYAAAENRYRDYGNALTHNAGLGFELELAPTVRMGLDAGPSYTQSQRLHKNLLGYHASINISKTIHANMLSLYYAHSSGDSTGLGSVSDTDNGGISFSRAFGRKVTLTANLSAFRGKGQLDNPYDSNGYYGASALSFMLNPHWFLNCGGSYRKNEGSSLLNATYEQVYLSIRYSLTPNQGRVGR